jgi:hypothetical protein
MKMVIRREQPAGASGAGATERIVPSAGETIVSSPPSGVRSGSRKKETRKIERARRTPAATVHPSQPAARAAASGGRMKAQPSRAIGILSG